MCTWGISHFQNDIDAAVTRWNNWVQHYLALLPEQETYSRGEGPCIEQGGLALPAGKELSLRNRAQATRSNQVLSGIWPKSSKPQTL